MTPPLLLPVPAVASGMGLPLLAASQPPDLATAIQQFATLFATGTAAVLVSVHMAVVAYLTCLLVGLLLYFTHARRMRKDLMVGPRPSLAHDPSGQLGLEVVGAAFERSYRRSATIPPRAETCLPVSKEESVRKTFPPFSSMTLSVSTSAFSSMLFAKTSS